MNNIRLFGFLLISLFIYTCEKEEDLSIIAIVGNSIITDDDFISAYSNKLLIPQLKTQNLKD